MGSCYKFEAWQSGGGTSLEMSGLPLCSVKQVDFLISENQALQIYLKHHLYLAS